MSRNVLFYMPCPNGVNVFHTSVSLVTSILHLAQNKIAVEMMTSQFLDLCTARNAAASRVLNTEGLSHLWFVDSDLAWDDPTAVRRMVEFADETGDPVMGIYPTRDTMPRWNTKLPKGNIINRRGGFVEIEKGPTGCMVVPRAVFEKIAAARPDLKVNFNTTDKDDKTWYFFMETVYQARSGHVVRASEDYGFCRLWRELGGKCWGLVDTPMWHYAMMARPAKFDDALKDIESGKVVLPEYED